MVETIMYYIRRVWYFINPKFLHIVNENLWYDGEEYLFELEDGTLLQFDDFDCEQECFRFLDGSRYYPVMEVIARDSDGSPRVWETVAFIRK